MTDGYRATHIIRKCWRAGADGEKCTTKSAFTPRNIDEIKLLLIWPCLIEQLQLAGSQRTSKRILLTLGKLIQKHSQCAMLVVYSFFAISARACARASLSPSVTIFA